MLTKKIVEAARRLVAAVETGKIAGPVLEEARRLQRLLPRPAPKKSPLCPTWREVKRARRSLKMQKTRVVWAAVMKRAGGACENCLLHNNLELDHFFGGAQRRSRESIETCWALCRDCHQEKTDNRPTREHWLRAFGWHCERSHMPVPPEVADVLNRPSRGP